MNTLKSIIRTLTSFAKQFYFIASVASILGILVIMCKESWSIYIALSFFCFMVLLFTSFLIFALFRIIENQDEDHENRSSFIKYETLDGNHITYEIYKVIQAKKPILTEFEFGFKWSGTIMPLVTSDLQDVINIVNENDSSKYDKAILKFKKPLYYNKNLVIHFKANLDDSDHKSSTHLESRVISETDIIHFRIILKHKSNSYNKSAALLKKKISSTVSTNYQKVKEISFDKATKSYEYHLLNPEIGYYYKIQWDIN